MLRASGYGSQVRIATLNVNGIRAAHRRGLSDWMATRACDVIALQEVRCPREALPPNAFGDYHAAYDPGTLPGRNGVAILTRQPAAAVRTWPTWGPGLARELREFAHEGRYIEADLADAPITIASLYLPKGGLPAHLQDPRRMREAPDGGAAYDRKQRFLAGLVRQLARSRRAARAEEREFLIMGDLNIAHRQFDVANWRRQIRNVGFLPEERAWMDEVIGSRRLIDVARHLHGENDGPYTWWSWLGQAFEKGTGWRIDYHLATPRLARSAVRAVVDREPSREARMSDHAAVVVDYALG